MIAGATQAAFGAPGAALGYATSPRAGTRKSTATQQYGMTMWFNVWIGLPGGRGLGEWASCTGLGVDFHADELTVGAHYDSAVSLPAKVSYPNITLERAMTTTASAEVQTWLREVTEQWINSAEGGAQDRPASGGVEGTTVTIELFHQLGETPVASWELWDVVPVSWSGPDMSSGSGTVATERLVLAHGGFLKAGARDGKATRRAPGLLTLAGPDGRKIPFQYNPASVLVSRYRGVGFGDRQNGGEGDLEIQGTNPWELDLGDLWIEGASAVRAATENLTAWLEPVATATSKTPQILDLTFGDGQNPLLTRKVALKRVNMSYTRFTRDGAPSRAKLTLEVAIVEPVAGAAAAPAATVTEKSQGDGLPALKNGSSKDLRATAAANGVDDIARIPNGTRLLAGGTP